MFMPGIPHKFGIWIFLLGQMIMKQFKSGQDGPKSCKPVNKDMKFKRSRYKTTRHHSLRNTSKVFLGTVTLMKL
jgi:hypothetical protein